jgi:uncharacterized membrane protein
LKRLWQYRYPRCALNALSHWCVVAFESGIEPVISFAKTLIRYAYGIINHCSYPIHTGRLESINNKIKVIKRKAYGLETGDIVQVMEEKGFHPLLATAIISMLPVFELRGGIPVGILMLKQNPISVYPAAVIGNLIPVYPILLFLTPVMKLHQKVPFMTGFLYFLRKRAQKNKKLLEKYEELGLGLFVAIPIPVTGAWTGAFIASILGLLNQ